MRKNKQVLLKTHKKRDWIELIKGPWERGVLRFEREEK